MLFYETIEKMPTFVESYPAKAGFSSTKAKIKRADSANLKGIVTNKLYRRLTVSCSEMPASF